jgi:lysophospholipase L1-like esterase
MKRGLRVFALAAAVALALVAIPASADDEHQPATYLALGDSYAFGFNPLVVKFGDPTNPNNFPGYTDAVAATLGLQLTNAACPGETSGSMISGTLPDNGCQFFRAHLPLHTAYAGAQLAFAVNYLHRHHHTRLVTLQIGGNDLLLLLQSCAGDVGCIQSGLTPVLASMGANLDTIYNALREGGDYEGTIVALPYFSFDYNNLVNTGITQALDLAEAQAAARHDARVADAFGAFFAASAPSHVPCVAGLQVVLTVSPLNCDIHPSAAGHAVYAQAVLAALPRHEEDD